ncbi:ATP-binding protein [Paenibacillus sp. UNC451MF]|uniref:ATP-binding protein n=1 Tax=Paenibacillus sp. UNC451MF TaxID=1449063 RepID=UPI00048AD191|nr:ATP-binding protein [Paenibacillus sp. UNC451MF]
MICMMLESCPCEQFIDMSDEMAENFLKYSGVPQYRKLCYAVHELVINAVEATLRHQASVNEANRCSDSMGLEHIIRLRMELEEGEVVITITNYAELGACQAIHSKRSANMDDLLHEERGRGLLIAKRWSDQLTFDQEEDGKITIQLRKRGDDAHGQNSIRSARKRRGLIHPF